MLKYIIRRLLLIIPTVFLAGTLVFFMLRVLPGDIVTVLTSEGGATEETKAKLRAELGLDDPLAVQYVRWLWSTARGQLGYSYYQDRYVSETVRDKLETTLTLALMAMAFSLLLAFPLGIISAIKRGSWWDQGIRVFTALSLAVPPFWLGILMIIFVSKLFNWTPPILYASLFKDPLTNLTQMAFPVLATGLTSTAIISRLIRSMMLEVLREDYVRTARAKGLVEHVVIVRHTLRNALIPVLTMAGFHFSFILSGVVVIENVFGIPGLGQQILASIFARDYDMVLGIVLALTVILATWILLVDLLYSVLDPRIRYG